MARYNILTKNFSKKNSQKLQKLLGKDFEIWQEQVPEDLKIHLVIINEKYEEVCQIIGKLSQNKQTGKVPFFLMSSFKENPLIECFQKGLDDFIDEKWSSELIKAKILAFFSCRKKFKKDSGKKIRIGNVSINPKKRKVTRKGEEVSLTKIEYDILNLLANDPGKIFSRDEIYNSIWGRHVIVGERTLDVHMNNLRKKIGKSKIRTKKGIGFGINPEL